MAGAGKVDKDFCWAESEFVRESRARLNLSLQQRIEAFAEFFNKRYTSTVFSKDFMEAGNMTLLLNKLDNVRLDADFNLNDKLTAFIVEREEQVGYPLESEDDLASIVREREKLFVGKTLTKKAIEDEEAVREDMKRRYKESVKSAQRRALEEARQAFVVSVSKSADEKSWSDRMDIINNFSTQFCNERKPVHERYVKPTELTRADAVDRIRSYISDTARCRVFNTPTTLTRNTVALNDYRPPSSRVGINDYVEFDRSGGGLKAPEGLVFEYPKPPAALRTSYRAVSFTEDGYFRKPLDGEDKDLYAPDPMVRLPTDPPKPTRKVNDAYQGCNTCNFGDRECLASCNQGDLVERQPFLCTHVPVQGSQPFPTPIFNQAYDSSGLPEAQNGARYRLNPEPVTYQNVRTARDLTK